MNYYELLLLSIFKIKKAQNKVKKFQKFRLFFVK
jgi:hypothetical protein